MRLIFPLSVVVCALAAMPVDALAQSASQNGSQAGANGQSGSAETEPASDPLHIRTTVVVTATRSEGDASKSPLSSSTITEAQLQARPLQSVDQHLALTEGVYVQRLQGVSATDANVSLRGFSGSSRTLVLLDGQPLNDAYSNGVNWTGLPAGEIESVEVARGPFSSLYGGNALGGVISIRTRAIDRRRAELSGDYGTYGTSKLTARYGDRFSSRVGLSVGFERFDTDGYNSRRFTATPGTGTGVPVTGVTMTRTTAGALAALIGEGGKNWLTQRAVRARGDYTVGSSGFLTAQYLRMDYRYGYDGYRSYLRDANGSLIDSGAVVFDDSGVTRRVSVTPNSFLQGPGEQHSNFYSASYRYAWSSGWLLRADGSYYHIPTYQFRSLGTGNTLTSGPGSLTDGNRHTMHGNLQLSRSLQRHDLTFGGEWRDERATNRSFALSNWTDRETAGVQTYQAGGRSTNASLYVQDQMTLTDRLTIVAGLRLDHWRGHDGLSDSFSATGPRTEYPARSRQQLSGKVAAGYALPGEWNVRVSAGTSFRNPNVFDLYATSVTGSGVIFAANPVLDPETVKSWEVGVRKAFARRFSADAAYFENRVDDLIYRQTDLAVDPRGNYRINVNAGAGRTRGFELSWRSELTRGVELRGSYTRTDAKVTANPGNPAIVGKRITFVPDQTAAMQLLLTAGAWTASLNGRYSGLVFNTDTNTDSTKGVPGSYSPFFTSDAHVSLQLNPRVQPFVSGENLLNRRYYTFYLSPGRTVTGGVRVRL
ncbi:MAG: TonB-dependent receptor [Vicinamibacterales bacterium]